MGFARAPAIQHHMVTGFEIGMVGGHDLASRINAGNHRKAPHHRGFAGNGQTILVVHSGVPHPHSDIALHQVGFSEGGQGNLLPALGLGDDNGLEARHGVSLLVF